METADGLAPSCRPAPPNSLVYASSKSAVDTVTLALARELGPRGIRVNAIAPGGVATEGTRANGLVGSEGERQIIAATPWDVSASRPTSPASPSSSPPNRPPG